MVGYLILSELLQNVHPPPLHNQNFSFLPLSEGRRITQIHRPLFRRYEFMTLPSLFFKVSLFHL